MTTQRMIELLEIEHECMLRGAHDDCDRNCADCNLVQDDNELHEMYTDVVALLKEQQERIEQLQQIWIPVSERLPEEKDGRVLICMPDKFPYNQNQPFPGCEVSERVTTGKYSEFSKRWYIGDMCGACGDDPIAWMPLPEPPKDGDEN